MDNKTNNAEQALDLLVRKFSLLLASSDLDEETQDALVSSLPHLSLEQIVELTNKLETKYAMSATSDIDAELHEQLTEVSTEFSEQQKERETALINQLQTMSASITK